MCILKEKTIVLKIIQLFQKQALVNRVVLGPVANGVVFTHVVITLSPPQIFPYYMFPFQNTAVCCLQSKQVTVVCVITVQANTDLGSPTQVFLKDLCRSTARARAWQSCPRAGSSRRHLHLQLQARLSKTPFWSRNKEVIPTNVRC